MDKKQWYKILGKEKKEINSVKDMIVEAKKFKKNQRVLVNSKNAPHDGEYGYVVFADIKNDLYTVAFENKKGRYTKDNQWSYNGDELEE